MQSNMVEQCDFMLKILSSGKEFGITKLVSLPWNTLTHDERVGAHTIIQTLIEAGYIRNVNSDTYFITPHGQQFINSGGFTGQYRLLIQEKEDAHKLNQLLIKTNESSIESNKFAKYIGEKQVQLTIISTVVALLAVIVTILQLRRNDGSELMQKLIDQQNQKFDSMVKVQQKIEQHLSRITLDTLRLPVKLSGSQVNKDFRKTSR